MMSYPAEEVKKKLSTSIPWQDKSLLVAEFHESQLDIHGVPTQGAKEKSGWSIRDSAKELGISIATISYDLRLARAIREDKKRFSQISKTNAIDLINSRDGEVRVELIYPRCLIFGTLIQSIQVKGCNHHIIKLDRPIRAEQMDIWIITLPYYHCRLFKE